MGASTSAPVVNVGYANYSGLRVAETGLDTYFGLYYAQAPIGNLRWAAPVAIENNKTLATLGVINATSPGSTCVQGQAFWSFRQTGNPLAKRWIDEDGDEHLNFLSKRDGPGESEDCLLLDVITPSNRGNTPLPVVVNFHGGGYIGGSSGGANGTYFTQYANSSIVWVEPQYRLGAYGFLGGADFSSAQGSPNVGLQDQRAALTWVQNHIAAFGGDPKKVTIWGGSAGGGSVIEQMVYNGGQNPPFRAAISEYPWMMPLHYPAYLQSQYSNLLSTAGCSNLACLRGLSFSALSTATKNSYESGYRKGIYAIGDFYYGPYVDGSIIREYPSQAFAKGRFAKVPLLIDRDDQEDVFFSNFSINQESAVKSTLQSLWPQANSTFFDQLFSLYSQQSFTGSYYDQAWFSCQTYKDYANSFPNISKAANNAPYWQLMTITSQFTVDCPTRSYAAAVAAAGINSWKMIFSTDLFLHTATALYLYRPVAESHNITLAYNMKDWWLSFILNLDPNVGPNAPGQSRPNWPAFGSSAQIMQVNNSTITGGPGLQVMSDRDTAQKCNFFSQQSSAVTN